MNRIARTVPDFVPDDAGKEPAKLVMGDTEIMLDCSGIAFLPEHRVLVVSDLHLEKATSYGRSGRFLPPYDTHKTLALLKVALDRHNPRHVISLGDSVHDEDGWDRLDDHCMALLKQLMVGRQWTWISGNHDPEKPAHFPGDSAQTLLIGDILFRHEPGQADLFGYTPENKTDGTATYEVCGHLHPAARITRRGKSVRRRCFASDGSRLVMPSFGVLTGGLCLTNKVFQGVLNLHSTTAYMIGRDRVYPVSGARLSR